MAVSFNFALRTVRSYKTLQWHPQNLIKTWTVLRRQRGGRLTATILAVSHLPVTLGHSAKVQVVRELIVNCMSRKLVKASPTRLQENGIQPSSHRGTRVHIQPEHLCRISHLPPPIILRMVRTCTQEAIDPEYRGFCTETRS